MTPLAFAGSQLSQGATPGWIAADVRDGRRPADAQAHADLYSALTWRAQTVIEPHLQDAARTWRDAPLDARKAAVAELIVAASVADLCAKPKEDAQ